MKSIILFCLVFATFGLYAQTQESNSRKIEDLTRRLDSLAGIRRAESTCDSLYEVNVKLLAEIQKLQAMYDKNQEEIVRLEGGDEPSNSSQEKQNMNIQDDLYYVIVKSFRQEDRALEYLDNNQILDLGMAQNQRGSWYHIYCCPSDNSSDVVRQTMFQRNNGFEQAWWVKGKYFK